MLGAIIGDLAGSIYEYSQFKKTSLINVDQTIEEDAFFSDDSILTIAIADGVLSGGAYVQKLKEYATKYAHYVPTSGEYFQTPFSPSFTKWAQEDLVGHSAGNGAMMRVSSIGYLFDCEEDVIKNARLATITSHDCVEAVDCATKVALAIFYARQGLSKERIIKKLGINIEKPNISKFNNTCSETIGPCFYALMQGNSFEECVRLAVSLGGDTDTNACIVGSMAEAIYGIDKHLVDKAVSKLPQEFIEVLHVAYAKINNLRDERMHIL